MPNDFFLSAISEIKTCFFFDLHHMPGSIQLWLHSWIPKILIYRLPHELRRLQRFPQTPDALLAMRFHLRQVNFSCKGQIAALSQVPSTEKTRMQKPAANLLPTRTLSRFLQIMTPIPTRGRLPAAPLISELLPTAKRSTTINLIPIHPDTQNHYRTAQSILLQPPSYCNPHQ